MARLQRLLGFLRRTLRSRPRWATDGSTLPASPGDEPRHGALLRDLLDVVRLYGFDATQDGGGGLRVEGGAPGRFIRITPRPLHVQFVGFEDPVLVAGISVPLDLRGEREQVLSAFAEKLFRLVQSEIAADELMGVVRELDLWVSHPDRATAQVSGRARGRRIRFAATGVVDRIELLGDWTDSGIAILPHPMALARDDRWLLHPAGSRVQVLARFGSAARLCVDDEEARRPRDRGKAGTKRR